MANRISHVTKRPGRLPFYEWALWLQGGAYELTQGVDFTCEIDGLRNRIHAVAKSHGMKARTSIHGGKTIQFEFFAPGSVRPANATRTAVRYSRGCQVSEAPAMVAYCDGL